MKAICKIFSFASVNTPCVAVKALKKSETTDEYIIRLYELTGVDRSDVKVTFASAIASAREVNGVEEELPDAPAVSTDGKTMTFSIGHYQPKTFAVRLVAPDTQVAAALPASSFVNLDFDTDMMSGHDGMTDATRGIAKAFPAELLSDELTVNDISFAIGSRERKANNALSCHGQTLKLSRADNQNKLYILALSTEEAGSKGDFIIGGMTTTLNVPYYGGYVGQAKTAFNFGPEYRRDEVAFTATHSHNVSNGHDETFGFLYIYKYALVLPEGVNEITLPDSKGLYLIAATLSDNNHDDARPASEIYTYPAANELGNVATFEDSRLIPDKISANGYVNASEAPHLANDGITDTKWCCTSANSWLEYSFNEDVVVNRWALLSAGLEGLDKITRDFKVQYHDGSKWNDISAVTMNTDNYLSAAVSPVTAKRFRLSVGAGEQGGNTARIYEFALYGHIKDNSGIADVTVHDVHNSIELLGSYPNPCHGEAEIRYSVPEGTSALRLEVYDMTGKALQSIALPVNDGNGGDYTVQM